MNKVKTIEEAKKVFDLLGIKEVGKRWQHKKGTWVYELPFKTMYDNGHLSVNRFSVYKSGYVRKMVVHSESNASYSCYQLNRVRKVEKFVKDYEWLTKNDGNGDYADMKWTGKYNKIYNNERIMIDNHRDRVIYLCNYILKNYYRSNKYNLVENYTMWRVAETHGEWLISKRKQDDLQFFNGDEHDLVASLQNKKEHDVQVIIDGKSYKLS